MPWAAAPAMLLLGVTCQPAPKAPAGDPDRPPRAAEVPAPQPPPPARDSALSPTPAPGPARLRCLQERVVERGDEVRAMQPRTLIRTTTLALARAGTGRWRQEDTLDGRPVDARWIDLTPEGWMVHGSETGFALPMPAEGPGGGCREAGWQQGDRAGHLEICPDTWVETVRWEGAAGAVVTTLRCVADL
jgi:hypothetical protein